MNLFVLYSSRNKTLLITWSSIHPLTPTCSCPFSLSRTVVYHAICSFLSRFLLYRFAFLSDTSSLDLHVFKLYINNTIYFSSYATFFPLNISLVRSIYADTCISSSLIFTGIISLSLFSWWTIRFFSDSLLQSQKLLHWTHRYELCLSIYIRVEFLEHGVYISSTSMRHCKTAHQYHYISLHWPAKYKNSLYSTSSPMHDFIWRVCVVTLSSGFICIS